MGDCCLYIFLDVGYDLVAAILGILCADFCCDGESGRYGHSQKIHFGKVSSLATEKVSHLGITFGLTVAERIDFLCHLKLLY